LSSTERSRRRRARLKAARGAGRPFVAGHELSTTHGAYRAVRVSEVAGQILADLLGGDDCPEHLKGGGGQYRYVLELWASAMAQARLLRAWLDGQDVVGAMTELTEGEESEVRPSPGSARRVMTSRRVSSVLEQLHRAETRAGHLSGRLGLDPLSAARVRSPRRPLSISDYWAEELPAGDEAGDSA
jgi:hypothetical protein